MYRPIFRRYNGTLNLSNEVKQIQIAKFLKETNAKSFLPEKPPASDKLIVPVDKITVSDLVGKQHNANTQGYYSISRTSTGSLPVYSDIRRGSQYTTIIRRIEGDVVLFKKELVKELPQIDASKFKVFQESKKVVITGDYVEEVKEILQKRI